MLIKQYDNKVEFGELKVGDVFRCDGFVYIKINFLVTDSGYEFNVYDLSNDDISSFSDNAIVEKVKAVLTVE